MKRKTPLAILTTWIALALAPADAARAAVGNPLGTIEGRVSNPRNGEYVERARITVDGTSIETFTDSDGNYRLTNVPAGAARVRAFFTGLGLQTTEANVVAGQTVQHDIAFASASPAATPGSPGAPVKLTEFVVTASREMDAAARAINEQRFAPNVTSVLAADEFGDISEGNIAEFLKFMPGVNIDSAFGVPATVSIDGVGADNVPVTMDGFNLASAVGASQADRSVGLDQFSINNLGRIEVSYSATPESQGMALGGSVNFVARSSIDRAKPLLTTNAYFLMRDDARNWSKTPSPRHPTRKIHPGFEFSYVNPVNKRFGYTLSGGFSRLYSGEPRSINIWRGAGTATNGAAFPHTTPDRPYLSEHRVQDGGRDNKRHSFGATIDYKPTRNDRLTFSLQATLLHVIFNRNTLNFNIDRVAPGDFTPTSTRGAAGQGTLSLTTLASNRANWTYTPTLTWRHDGPVWKMEAAAGLSRAQNHNRDVSHGFFNGTTARRSGVTIAFDDIFYLRPNRITVTDATGAPVNPYSLDSYSIVSANGSEGDVNSTQRTAYANVRRAFRGRVPLALKAGVDFREAVRDRTMFAPSFIFAGADNRAAPFRDPSFSSRVGPFGHPKTDQVSSELLHGFHLANPGVFTTNANTTYRSQVSTSKYAQELVSSAYLRGDLEFFERRLKLVGGIRAEQTNIKAEGPLTDLSRNVRRDPQGRPLLDASGRPQLIAAPNTLEFSQLTFINRGYRAEKEYLSWFPSINASYNVRENLIARLAYSTSIGRPSYQQYAGGINLPDPDNPSPNDRITVSNVALKPWSAHAVHARLEYYFEGVGQVSVAAFRRDFEDFFGGTTFDVTPEFLALYNLDPAVYGNYDVQTQHNIQSAVRMQGLSVSYKQALTFLPAWARGVQVFANGSAQRLLGSGTSNFIGFIPRTASWGASLSRPRYTLRANWNYRGRQRRNAVAVGNSIEPGTFNWFSKRLYLDLSGEYRFAKHYALYASMRNAGDATEDTEIHGPNTPAHAHLRTRQQFGSVWTIGIKGTF